MAKTNVVELYPSSAGVEEESSASSAEVTDIEKKQDDIILKGEFWNRLLDTLQTEPIENGYSHPAEEILKEVLEKRGYKAIPWIQSIYLESLLSNPSIAAALMRCIARLDRNRIDPWGVLMAVGGLSSPVLEVREEAVRALEMWAVPSAVQILSGHEERVKWLADYIQSVIENLKH